MKIFNPRMIRERIAQLTAMSGSPTNCGGQPSREEAKAEIAKMENILADCRARKASAKPGTPMPLIACLADKTAVREAISARLDAGRAKFAAVEAQQRAKAAAAALQPAARATQQPAATMPPGLDAKARRAWSKNQSTMTAENATRFDDSYLQVAATHRNSPPAEASIAKAELESRGYVFHGNGTISKSL